MSHKIDDFATRGLLGTVDSLAYRLGEIERHFHSYESWMCAAAVPSATHIADRIGVTAASKDAFVITSGNDAWGNWVQVLGSGDTPIIAGNVKYDVHRIVVAATNQAGLWFIQLAFGATGADALAANTFCSFVHNSEAVNDKADPADIMTRRQSAATLAWVRAWSVGTNGKTISVMFGLHEYEG